MIVDTSLAIIDSHCHLNFAEFDRDREQVISRAQANNITKLIIPGIDIETSKTAITLSNVHSMIYAAIGVHPNSGNCWTTETVTELKTLAQNPKVVAIGEIGLDYYRNYTARDLQCFIFDKQLELAKELDLPVIIHNRQASKDILDIVQTWHQGLVARGSRLAQHPGVMHSYSGNIEYAKKYTDLEFKIGITGPITYKNSQDLREVVSYLALDKIIVETDSPYLTPHPYRGKRNEPANVRIVAEKIAEIKVCSLEKVSKITTAGANSLFNWRESH